ncbi:response regulator [Stieleria marina]|uniref:Alkaline phosphatase synthesis transcriptional regulatory protein PhoP n=1 Tax=Stieleria marina TaxID=1930275 RepID=A0A517NPU7_9BACT|nr:Alkaline phosphatase synthesis transcriptional regulatory protein PhoP [Planctomycetes bacterium K23_9]
MPASDKVLVVDDSPTQRELLKILLEENDFQVQTAANGEEALKSALADPPIIVITDLQMPGMDGLELTEQLKMQLPLVPVVLTTSQGSEEIAAAALQRGAASYVPKRDLARALAPTIRQVLSLIHGNLEIRSVLPYTTAMTLELRVENDDSLVPGVIARLEQAARELELFDESEWMQVAMALGESLLNAMIHGNLEVSSELREKDDGQAYIKMIGQRRSESPYCDRRVLVRLDATKDVAEFLIRDEGPGFDASALGDPTDPENLESVGGRGLLLINAFMDSVQHNETGNEIMMVKSKPEAVQA